ncbi:MAG TPA: CpaF family protein [Microthrixaceae bacterium]|nr:CpaF family protein [Microthrixaceae bacterium]MCB9376003.1 CpaF family protein [Microthrixaceae bacterium]MCB9400214.1 CpaF family protein [Microthrixaceae bacterium]MCC6183877.1 CpaF family protein [Microthrixaceae bacterium]MCO5304469.1 CpaF family protein [Microthrixaceae bacterium]
MSLYQRINEQQGGPPVPPKPGQPGQSAAGQPPAKVPPGAGAGTPGGPAARPAQPAPAPRRDPALNELRHRIHQQLIDELGPILFDRRLSEQDLRRRVHEQLHAAIAAERVPLSAADKAQLIQDVSDDILGYGPIDKLLRDEDVTEVMVNGPDLVFVERSGKLTKDESIRFIDSDHVRRVIDKIVSEVGRRVDESTPMVDARLPDGSRVNAVISPLSIGGPFLTIRKFATDPLQIDDLIRFGSLNAHSARFLQACIVGKLNVIVAGGTGTGKTTMLNVLSSFIPEDERIITVEDAKELQLHQEHVLCMESRPPNVEGRGEVTIRDLVKNCLRMRPDRIVVGECRSGEALDMLQAMNTGHDGSLTTVHANSPRDTLARLETLVLMAGFDLPVRAIREQMASAIDVIVQLSRLRDGTRRVTHITEVQGMEGDVITLQDVFLFDFGAGVDENGRYRGQLQATGVRPKFAEKLADQGIRLGPEVFARDGGRKAVTGR